MVEKRGGKEKRETMAANRFYDETICFVQAIFSGASSPFRKYNISRAINVESSRCSPETRRCAKETSPPYITFHSTSFGRKRVATNRYTRSLHNAMRVAILSPRLRSCVNIFDRLQFYEAFTYDFQLQRACMFTFSIIRHHGCL